MLSRWILRTSQVVTLFRRRFCSTLHSGGGDASTSLGQQAQLDRNEGSDQYKILAESLGVRDIAPSESQNVLVIHPKIRWGRNSARASTTADLQLQEAIALTNTLPNFRVCSSIIVGTDYSTKKKRIWGRGRLEALDELKEKERATALMINVDVLSPVQQSELYSYFRVPIYDRYNIVLLIFKMFAKTKEARLQIELAEIPYIRHRLKCINTERTNLSAFHINSPVSNRNGTLEILRYREQSLRKRLKLAVEEKETTVSEETSQRGVAATVALVGYTNAGKSSLIKRLTGNESIFVEDRLFATLDASSHFCRLPSGIPILLTDTIGFISDLPVQLFASFRATLSHVLNADLLLMVEDVSHPDRKAQREIVLETLEALDVKRSLIESIIFIGNKCDKIDMSKVEEQCDLLNVSCVNSFGIKQLIAEIDKKVMALRGSVVRHMKLRSGSPALAYLYKESLLVKEPIPIDDGNFLLCTVIMDDAQMAMFRARFNLAKVKSQQKISS